MRAFLALDLEESWRASAERLRKTVCELDGPWAGEKWVRPDLLHVTLAFFGDIDADVAASLGDAASPLFDGLGGVRLVPSGVSARPNRRHARLLWVDFEPHEALTSLVAEVTAEARALGVAVEERSFRPHQTLVRARRPRSISERALEETTRQVCRQGSVSVPSATLFESVLGRTGPEYREVRTWRLS